MLNIVLFEPEIPQNTGNIARTCAVTGIRLHLIRPLGFDISDKAVKRAGLDYWHLVDLHVYDAWRDFFKDRRPGYLAGQQQGPAALHAGGLRDGSLPDLRQGDRRAAPEFRERYRGAVRIPIRAQARCLNLSNSAAILAYEALRQLDFPGLTGRGEMGEGR